MGLWNGSLAAWKTDLTATIWETLAGDVPTAALRPGKYTFGLLAVPRDNPAAYYLGVTFFRVTLSIL